MFLELKTEEGEVFFVRASHIDEIAVREYPKGQYYLHVQTNTGLDIVISENKESPEQLYSQYEELKKQFIAALNGKNSDVRKVFPPSKEVSVKRDSLGNIIEES